MSQHNTMIPYVSAGAYAAARQHSASIDRSGRGRIVVSGRDRALTVPWPLKLVDSVAWLQRWPAQLLGVGVRPEHVRSPDSP